MARALTKSEEIRKPPVITRDTFFAPAESRYLLALYRA